MRELRKKFPSDLFDYTFLMKCLSNYKSPRSKVTHLLKSGEIIRIKKGLYVFGPDYRREILNIEAIANQIYGPSYVSLEYALGFYGLIPEFVFEVTSVTTKKRKLYETPIGRFSYAPIPSSLFSTGFTLIQTTLIATPEKALTDLFYVRKLKIDTASDLEPLLFDDLRLYESGIKKMRIGILSDILNAGGSPIITHLINWIRSNK